MTLKLYWDIMPVSGSLELAQRGSSKFSMPTDYVMLSDQECIAVPGGAINPAGTPGSGKQATAKLGSRKSRQH
jgi:hypothetical protein